MGRLSYDAKFVGYDAFSVDLDTGANSPENLLGGFLGRKNQIFLRQAVTRVHDPIRHFAVVGEQQESFGVPVQPSHREQACSGGQKVHHSSPVTFVTCRGYETGRLVHHDVSKWLPANRLPVHANVRAPRVDFGPKFGDDLAVNRDTA